MLCQLVTSRGAGRGFDPRVLIWLSNCEGVRFEGYTVTARGPCGRALPKATPTAVNTVGETGGVIPIPEPRTARPKWLPQAQPAA